MGTNPVETPPVYTLLVTLMPLVCAFPKTSVSVEISTVTPRYRAKLGFRHLIYVELHLQQAKEIESLKHDLNELCIYVHKLFGEGAWRATELVVLTV